MLQATDEDGDLGMGAGQAVDLMSREQHDDPSHEHREPRQQPADVGAHDGGPVSSTLPRKCDAPLHDPARLYRADGVQTSRFAGVSA